MPYNFTYAVPNQALIVYSQLSIIITASTIPRANATLFWGASATPSLARLRLSGYDSLSQNKPLEILNSGRVATSGFDLNATIPNNVIIFQASVRAAFGYTDVQRVNLTLVDPLLRPVKGATNLDMRAFPVITSQTQQPYLYTAFWVYPSNATEGTYQANVEIVDEQNLTAFSFRGPATFGLSRAGPFSGAPLNLIPYFAVAGVVAAGGAMFYSSRRRRKSYLVPFDHFNTLIGGELDGGTVVTVEGNTGSGKSLLSEQMMFEDLKKGRPCVFVATGDFPSNIRENMKSMGLDPSGYEQSGLLTFVDGYSSEAGQESQEKFSIPSLGDLTTMNMKIASSLPSGSFKGGSLYFDSLTPLASRTKPDSLVSFVQSVGAKVKGMGGKAFFTVGPSVDGTVHRRLEDMADCVVQMEAFEERGARKSRLKIIKLRSRRFQQGWVIYTIEGGRGIIFYSKKPRQ